MDEQKHRDYFAVVLVPCQMEQVAIPFYLGGIPPQEEWETIRAWVDAFYANKPGRSTLEITNAWRRFRLPHDGMHPEPGFVYFLRSEDGYVKIGRTTELDRRIEQLRIQLPFRASLFHSIKTTDPIRVERYFHALFAGRRMNGEWFRLADEDLESIRAFDHLEPACCRAMNTVPGVTALGFLGHMEAHGYRVSVVGGEVRIEPDDSDEHRDALRSAQNFAVEIAEILDGRRCDVCGSPIDRGINAPATNSEMTS